jgi:hypothetical protein
MRYLISTLAAMAVSAIIVDAANAQATSTWNGSVSTNWATAGNWTASGGGSAPPAGGDLVVIPDASTTSNDPNMSLSSTYAGLHLQPGGYFLLDSCITLTITGSGGLDLDAGSVFEIACGTLELTGGGTHSIDGELLLSSAASIFSITTNSATVSGSGHIKSDVSGNAEIRVAANTTGSPITLTSSMLIEGMLKIRGMQPGVGQEQGRFINGATGVVKANVAGMLELKEGAFDDADGALWRVESNANAVLRFSVAPASLDGDFMIAAGTLDIDASVSTAGGLCFTGGAIDVAASKSFSATGAPTSCP